MSASEFYCSNKTVTKNYLLYTSIATSSITHGIVLDVQLPPHLSISKSIADRPELDQFYELLPLELPTSEPIFQLSLPWLKIAFETKSLSSYSNFQLIYKPTNGVWTPSCDDTFRQTFR